MFGEGDDRERFLVETILADADKNEAASLTKLVKPEAATAVEVRRQP
jgi:hypothetical protein